jgi:hypothetical protein
VYKNKNIHNKNSEERNTWKCFIATTKQKQKKAANVKTLHYTLVVIARDMNTSPFQGYISTQLPPAA